MPAASAPHESDAPRIEDRHLGLMPAAEAEQSQATIAQLGRAVAAGVDLDQSSERTNSASSATKRFGSIRWGEWLPSSWIESLAPGVCRCTQCAVSSG